MYHNQKSEDKSRCFLEYQSFCSESAVEEVLEPEIHKMSVGMLSLLSSVAVSLVGIGHEMECFAQVDEFID